MSYTIVGVIGHIDHGKTSLVAALTGVDTDTHPEEKRRGITIDLGFASFTENGHQFALIDAPGHQRYVGNLLAGVSRIDVGLLVVACDQGIQAQTLEHASILQLLGVRRLVVVISRIDLADAAACDELRGELELFLEDYDFHDVPMIPVSTVQSRGIDELKLTLFAEASQVQHRPFAGFFRMPVDRVFSMPGRGCVVAGTVWSGSVKVGDHLELGADRRMVRVRDVEVHGEQVAQSVAGHRTALNVVGVAVDQVHRGDEVLDPEVFPRSSFLLMEVKTVKTSPTLKCPATVQLHLGATACRGRITGVRRLQPGESAVVLVEADQPVVATFGQRCLFRLPYPVGTVGGASVLAALDQTTRRTRTLIELGEQLAMSDAAERIVAWVDFCGELEASPVWCELQAGISRDAILEAVDVAVAGGRVIRLDGGTHLASVRAMEQISRRAQEFLHRQAQEARDAWIVEESLIRQLEGFGTPELVRMCLQQLVDQNVVVRLGRMVAIASDETSLSKKQRARLESVVAAFEGNRSPPTLKELSDQLQLPLDAVTSLTRFGVQTGMLLDAGNGLLISSVVFAELCQELLELFHQQSRRSVAEIRDRWNVTRKHAVPFLEFCDRLEITVRDENERSAGPAIAGYAAPLCVPPSICDSNS
ncbi:MAG: selenocysteine-specific translation elongation factor [Planctomycetaceae bacterium]|nr:selenocysteine-specific translation elongation factor [Planctomycetaceae bacterium]